MSTLQSLSNGTDAVEGMNRASDGNYINSDGNVIITHSNISNQLPGFPATITKTSTLSLAMKISVTDTVTYTYNSGTCTGITLPTGGPQVDLTATVN